PSAAPVDRASSLARRSSDEASSSYEVTPIVRSRSNGLANHSARKPPREAALVVARKPDPRPRPVALSDLAPPASGRDRVDPPPLARAPEATTNPANTRGARVEKPTVALPAPKIDLNDLAERIQRIFERQSIHEHARRGLR